mgnify:CR=1 FL=1
MPTRGKARKIGIRVDAGRQRPQREGHRRAEDQQDRIFTKFFRRAGERRTGTGLGLYISKGIVERMMEAEQFSHVTHLVSEVAGELREGVSHFDLLRACFPAGTVTGAPKIRAMQIIDELETVTRGPYTGALGYLGFNRESQFSILIRTAVLKDGHAHFHVGAGIVADSNRALEYEETLAKAAGFLHALGAETEKRQPSGPALSV